MNREISLRLDVIAGSRPTTQIAALLLMPHSKRKSRSRQKNATQLTWQRSRDKDKGHVTTSPYLGTGDGKTPPVYPPPRYNRTLLLPDT